MLHGATTTEACAQQREKPSLWEAWAPQQGVAQSLQLDKAHSNEDSAQLKINKSFFFFKKEFNVVLSFLNLFLIRG